MWSIGLRRCIMNDAFQVKPTHTRMWDDGTLHPEEPKRQSTLSEQVAEAQREVESWTPERRDNASLEGAPQANPAEPDLSKLPKAKTVPWKIEPPREMRHAFAEGHVNGWNMCLEAVRAALAPQLKLDPPPEPLGPSHSKGRWR